MLNFCRQLLLSCFCCHHCPNFYKSNVSSSTRTGYYLIFLSSIILNTVALIVKPMSKKLPFCLGDETFVCRKFYHYLAVYRISFAYEMFFLFMWLVTIEISSSRNPRAVFHNGFWFFKVVWIGLLIICFSFIPYGWFDVVLMYVACIVLVGFHNFELFALCQITVNLGYLIYDKLWVKNACYKFFCTFGVVILTAYGILIGLFLLLIYNKCLMNLVIICVNLALSYIVGALMAFVRLRRRERVEALQSCVLTSFVMVITWSAVANNPKEECSPRKDLGAWFFIAVNLYLAWIAVVCIFFGLKFLMRDVEVNQQNSIVLLEQRGDELCGVWGRPIVVNTVSLPEGVPSNRILFTSTDETDDEYTIVKYTWSAFHHIILNGLFYFMFCLTENYYLNWEYETHIPDHFNDVAMWSKLISTWFCLILFFLAGMIRKKYIY